MKGEQERWASVPGFDGIYEVSSRGAVRSWVNGRWGIRTAPRLRSQFIGSSGYPEVGLRLHGKKRNRLVHELVLLSFVGARPSGCVACHANDKRTDNRLANLRWASRRENHEDSIRNGGAVLNGPRANAKLNVNRLRRLLNRLAKGDSNRVIAKAFGISHSRVSNIRNGTAYARLCKEKAT